MSYLIGTKKDCQTYNNYVSSQIGLKDPYGWAQIRKHPQREEWAIMKHAIHTSNSLTESELDETWNEDNSL